MNLSQLFPLIQSTIAVAKLFLDGGRDVAPIISKLNDILLKGHSITKTDLEELRAMNAAWKAEIQKPLEPEQD